MDGKKKEDKRKERTERLDGSTYYIKNIPRPDSDTVVDVRLVINESEGQIFEIFLDSSCPAFFEWFTAFNRMASMAMQYGIPIIEVVDCLENIHSTVTCHPVPGVGMCSSLPTRIGQILRAHYLRKAE